MSYTTQQARNAYPEFVVGGVTSSWVVTGSRPVCDYTIGIRVRFLAGGSSFPRGEVWLLVHPSTVEANMALAAVMATHNYLFRETAGGSVSCRKITNGTRTSPHAHGISDDFNPSKNSYRITAAGGLIQWGRQTDMSKQMIADIEAIRTIGGHKVWEWGGRWWTIKDPMHFQPTKCTRAQLEAGIDWSRVNGTPIQEDTEMTLKRGDKGRAVAELQHAGAQHWGWKNGTWSPHAGKSGFDNKPFATGEDGSFGATTETNVKAFQKTNDLPETGRVDGVTSAMLFAPYGKPAAPGLTEADVKAIINDAEIVAQ